MDVIVFGSLIMDMIAYCDRHPLPKETVVGERLAMMPGGKGLNQAIAAARANASVQLIGATGNDDFGRQLLQCAKDAGVNSESVTPIHGTSSGVGAVTVNAKGENSIVVIPGANSYAHVPAERIMAPTIALAQFETPLRETEKLFRQVRAQGGITILNPSPYRTISPDLLSLCSYLIVNEIEFAALTGRPVTQDADTVTALLQQPGSYQQDLIVTLGDQGYVMRTHGMIHRAAGHAVIAVDSVGAGDCFAGSFAARLALGDQPQQAAHYANAAAALSVMQPGAAPSMPSAVRVLDFINQNTGKISA